MAELILAASHDCRILEATPDTKYNDAQLDSLSDFESIAEHRSLLRFDFSALSNKAFISSGVLSLYMHALDGGDPRPCSIACRKVTQTGWDEANTTWNQYNDSGNLNWATPGGDWSGDNQAVSNILTSQAGWYEWDITAMCRDFQATAGSVADVLIFKPTQNGGFKFYSAEEAVQTTLRPKLVITYYIMGNVMLF